MKAIISFLINRPKIVHLALFFILAMGGLSLYKMERTGFPNVDFGMIVISTVYPGASAEDIELKITNKIEEKLNDISDVKRISSASIENVSQISVEMLDSADFEKAEADIQKLVDQIQDFPADLPERPQVSKVNNERIPVVEISISSPKNSYDDVYDKALLLEDELLQLNEVSKVIVSGMHEREIQILADYRKLARYQLSFDDLTKAVQQQNIRSAGGDIRSELEKKIVIRSDFQHISDIENVIVRSGFEQNRVLLKDVADVRLSYAVPETLLSYNSKPAVQLSVLKKAEQDILDTSEAAQALIKDFANRHPEVAVELITDYSYEVIALLNLVKKNAVLGLFLVLGFLMILLEKRIAFWTAVGIPTSILLAFMFLPNLEVNINFISLMGIIIVLGMVVDDAIVVAENIYKYREKGMGAKEASIKGTLEVMWPVIATVSTTIVAFMPLMFMTGVMGKFMIQMPIVVSLILLGSLFECLFILPPHIADSQLKPKKDLRKRAAQYLEKHYKAFTQRILGRFKCVVLGVFILIFALSIVVLNTRMQFILFDNPDGLYGAIEFETEVGMPLHDSQALARTLEEHIASMPDHELDGYVTIVGEQKAALTTYGTNVNHSGLGNILIYLSPFKERSRVATEIMDDLKARVEHLPGFSKLAVFAVQDGPPVGKAITVTLAGPIDEKRNTATKALYDYISSIEGVNNVESSEGKGKQLVSVDINHQKAARQAIPVPSIVNSVRSFFQGSTISTVRWGSEELDIRLSVPESDKKELRNAKKLLLTNYQGTYVPIGDLISSKEDSDILKVSHYNKLRSVTLYADVDTDIITSQKANELVRDWATSQQANNPSVQYIYGGEEKDSQEAMQSLGIAMIFALIGIYSILVILFNSFSQPFVVMSAIPFTMPGIIYAFYMHDKPFGFMAIIGLIGLTGVVVNNSLIMISSINNAVDEHGFNFESISMGAAKRLRPIILTTITTAAGLFPTVYGFGGENAFIIPMIMAVAWGLIFASVVTLFLTPTLYVIHAKVFRRKELQGLSKVD